MVYFVGRAQTISLYFVVEAVMPRRKNCASACTNQIWEQTGQDKGNCIATVAMVVGGSSNNMSVTVWIMSHKKNLVNGVHLVRVTNCGFYIKNY